LRGLCHNWTEEATNPLDLRDPHQGGNLGFALKRKSKVIGEKKKGDNLVEGGTKIKSEPKNTRRGNPSEKGGLGKKLFPLVRVAKNTGEETGRGETRGVSADVHA